MQQAALWYVPQVSYSTLSGTSAFVIQQACGLQEELQHMMVRTVTAWPRQLSSQSLLKRNTFLLADGKGCTSAGRADKENTVHTFSG